MTPRRIVARLGALAALLAVLGPASVRGQEAATADWDIEDPHAPTVPLRFTAEEGTWMSVDVAPDGERLVFNLLGHLYELPMAGGDARPLTSGRSWNMHPRYAPDGRSVAFTSDRDGADDLWVLELTRDSLRNVSKQAFPTYRPTWSGDGAHLYGSILDHGARAKGVRFDFHGSQRELLHGAFFQPVVDFVERPGTELVYFEQNTGGYPASGPKIRVYDRATGEVRDYIERPGGAFAPAISRDGRRLAYVHRADQETVLVVHDLETRAERVVLRGLDRDRQEYGAYQYGVYPGIAWHPDGRRVVLARGGRLEAVDVETGDVARIPFRAPVDRQLNRTMRFPAELPEGAGTTRAHRWAQRTDRGILYEALGDLWLKTGDAAPRNLTATPEHETSPVWHAGTGTLYYASWSDAGLGAVHARPLDGGASRRLTSVPTQYGSIAVSADGRSVAFVRGSGRIPTGLRLEAEQDFQLVVIGPDGQERVVTEVSGTPHHLGREPFEVRFAPAGDRLHFTEFHGDTLALKSIRLDGLDERTLYLFPHAAGASLSTDGRWVAFREYHRSYLTPFDYVGKPVTVSPADKQGVAFRVDDADGTFMAWSADGATLSWLRGPEFHEKRIAAIVQAQGGDAETGPGTGTSHPVTDLGIRYEVEAPAGVVALTGVRVLTMDPQERVIENATIVVRGGRIEAVGQGVAPPPEARVFDLAGHTVMPGIVDAHGHYNGQIASTQVIEQHPASLLAPLAHGVTTLYELYGTNEKDFWLSDMIRAGRVDGPRLLSVGAPIYGLRFFRPKTYRGIESYEDARQEVAYNKAWGATALKDYVLFQRSDRHQLATAAREAGINVVAETAGNPEMNWTQVIDGVTGLEHTPGLTPLYDDVVQLLAASEVGITPTLLVVYNGPVGQQIFETSEKVWENEKLLEFTRREDLMAYRRPQHLWPDDVYAPTMAAAMKRLRDAGVSINVGGHGQMLGLDVHWEMELFTKGGFSPLETIRAATIDGARYHGLDHELGSIEAGKRADLVVLREDPTTDIRNTRTIRYVMKNGVLYAGEDAARVWPEARPAAPRYFRPVTQ